MIDAIKNNKIVVILVGVGIAALAWYLLSGSAVPERILSQNAVDQERQGVEAELITFLLEVRNIRLNAQIFSNPAFLQLKDFSTEIVPEPTGRDNPFAPPPAQFGAQQQEVEGGGN